LVIFEPLKNYSTQSICFLTKYFLLSGDILDNIFIVYFIEVFNKFFQVSLPEVILVKNDIIDCVIEPVDLLQPAVHIIILIVSVIHFRE